MRRRALVRVSINEPVLHAERWQFLQYCSATSDLRQLASRTSQEAGPASLAGPRHTHAATRTLRRASVLFTFTHLTVTNRSMLAPGPGALLSRTSSLSGRHTSPSLRVHPLASREQSSVSGPPARAAPPPAVAPLRSRGARPRFPHATEPHLAPRAASYASGVHGVAQDAQSKSSALDALDQNPHQSPTH